MCTISDYGKLIALTGYAVCIFFHLCKITTNVHFSCKSFCVTVVYCVSDMDKNLARLCTFHIRHMPALYQQQSFKTFDPLIKPFRVMKWRAIHHKVVNILTVMLTYQISNHYWFTAIVAASRPYLQFL